MLLALALGFALRGARAPVERAAPRRLPARRRLAGDPDRGDRAAARLLVGLRRAAEARRDRADLLLPGAVTTVDALRAIDRDQLKLLRTLDASRWQAFRFAELPAALPAALAGARIALAIGVIGAYIAESQTATSSIHAGLGHEINADLTALQTARAYAAAVVLFALAIACFYALSLAERTLAPWAQRHEENRLESQASRAPHLFPPEAAPARRARRARDRAPAACPAARGRLLLVLAACGSKQDMISSAAGPSRSRRAWTSSPTPITPRCTRRSRTATSARADSTSKRRHPPIPPNR